MKKKNHQVQGRFVELRITEQYNERQLTFKKTARLDSPYEVERLFIIAEFKGLDLSFFKKRRESEKKGNA